MRIDELDELDRRILHWLVRNRMLQEIAELERMSRDGVRSRLRVIGAKLDVEPARIRIAMSALRAGVLPVPRTAPKNYFLDGEQIHVVRLVADDRSNDEIGAELGYNARTAARRIRGVADMMGYYRLEEIRLPVAVTGFAHGWIS